MARSMRRIRSLEDLWPNPLVYDRAAFMEHIRRYDRESLRSYYLRQPVEGAHVWANYAVNLWEYEHGVEELTSYPWNVTIPITEACNASCAFCSSPLVPEPKALAVEEVRHFAEALRHAVRVSLQGLGEPLAHPRFEELAEEIRKYLSPVAQLEIITNGWLLSGRRWELLKALRIAHIQVSVNAATDRTHQVAMGSRPGTFDKVLTNIRSVLADPDWAGLLKVSMVVTRHSLPEVPDFLDILSRHGVNRFQFNALLPLTTPDWGFGRTDQYVDLWCGHLPNARELVATAAAAIAEHRGRGTLITASPDQWLLPVAPLPPRLIQLSPAPSAPGHVHGSHDGSSAAPSGWEEALSVCVADTAVPLTPHERHAEVIGRESARVRFRTTPESRRWAYLLLTSPFRLPRGEYGLDFDLDIQSGEIWGGVLDVERGDFLMQAELRSGRTRMTFALPDERAIDIIIRQGSDDSPADATYRSGRLAVCDAQTRRAREPVACPDPKSETEAARTATVVSPIAASTQLSIAGADPAGLPPKPGRIYCPMVYTTLSVFHHSLDVSVCCYMENAPGQRSPTLTSTRVLQAYNQEGFRIVRRTLNTDEHMPVCESCPYGESRL